MTTPRLGAPELTSGQAVPETTVNEQIRYIEAGAGHFVFLDRDLIAPPGSPADGDCYFIAAGTTPTGAWAGHAGKVAFRVNTAWAFITPINGFTAVVVDESRLFVGYNASTQLWDTLSSPAGSYLPLTGGTLSGDVVVPAEAYGVGWNGSNEAPTKNDVYDKIEAVVAAVPGSYTDEMARDAIGAALVAGVGTEVSVDDGGDTITIRGKPSVQAVTSSATVTPTFSDNLVKITAQAAGLTLANPSGTAVPGHGIAIRIKDNGTARSIGYGTQYRAIGVTLPTTTVISKTLYLGCIWNADDTKLDVVAVAQEA